MKVILKFRRRFWNMDMKTLIGGKYAIYWPALGNQFSDVATLTAFCVGEHADRLRQSGMRPASLLLDELDRLFGNKLAVENFIDSYELDWTDEPFIGGYVTIPTSASYFDDKTILAEPVQNKVFFAGEATNADPNTLGYVHGAMATGARAAKELVNSILSVGEGL